MDSTQTTGLVSESVSQTDAYRLFLECIAEGVCSLDLQGNITFLNHAALQLLDVEPDTLLGCNFHELAQRTCPNTVPSSPDICPICRSLDSVQALNSGQEWHVHHDVFWRPNGTSFPVEYSVRPLRDATADYGYVITFSDSNKRQIHDREMLYILTSAKCLLWYADIQYVRSKGRLRWFLWPADPIAAQRFLPIPIDQGQSFAEAYYACRLDEDKAPSNDYGTQEILAGRDYHQEYRCRRADGAIRWIAEDVQIEQVGEDRWRAAGVCTDITELKQRESEIALLNARLQRAMIETHHRVKNNLQIISALIELQTIDQPESLPLAEFARLSHHVRSLAVVHDLLTREAKTTGQTETISARTILEQLLSTIAQTTGKASLQYQLEDAPLSNHQSTSLALITNELTANAMKHGNREVRLHFSVRDETAFLEVCDDGPGFPSGFSPLTSANTGIELIETLTRKDLSGQTRYENRAEGGARVTVQFPLYTGE